LARRLGLCLILAATLASLSTGVARADGDPASDLLYLQDVFVTYSKPSPDLVTALTTEVANANAAGYRIKVAVIATPIDLGSVPTLLNQPQVYARFLGAELALFYTNRLLVVMPAGFGVYNNGAPTDAEEAILAGVKIEGPDPDSLTRAATTAVQSLVAAGKPPPPKDTLPPKVKAFPVAARRGKVAKLRYTVLDDSGQSRQTVRVYGPRLVLYATIPARLGPATSGRVLAVSWRVPKKIKGVGLKFCVLARDPSGNESRPGCAPIRLR
jgi:hypothetical protein